MDGRWEGVGWKMLEDVGNGEAQRCEQGKC
jgi:hypothetical protein